MSTIKTALPTPIRVNLLLAAAALGLIAQLLPPAMPTQGGDTVATIASLSP